MGPGALGMARLQCALKQKWVSNPMEGSRGHSFLVSPPPGPSHPPLCLEASFENGALKQCLFHFCLVVVVVVVAFSVCNVRMVILQKLMYR